MPQKVKARRAATEAANRCRPQAMSSWLEGVFESAGLSRSDSEAVAKNLTEAEERGIRSHGLILLPVYVERIRSGGIRGRYTMTVVREHGATLLLDGDGGPGQSLAFRATELAIAGARKVASARRGSPSRRRRPAGGGSRHRLVEDDVPLRHANVRELARHVH